MPTRSPSETALPVAWQSPSDARPPIPGDKVREVAGHNVHHWNDRDWLSTGTVLAIMGIGSVAHVPPAALEYGRLRGKYVDDACKWLDAGTLDRESLDSKIRPYVDAYEAFLADHAPEILTTEEFVVNPRTGVFGYSDRRVKIRSATCVLDVKTSAFLGKRERYQVVSYAVGGRVQALLLQLKKDGTYLLISVDKPTLYPRWVMLCEEAHDWVREQQERK